MHKENFICASVAETALVHRFLNNFSWEKIIQQRRSMKADPTDPSITSNCR